MNKRTKHIMNEKDEIRRVDKNIRENEGYMKGGKVMADSKKARSKKTMGGGKVKGYKKGGTVSSASKRADGCATKGHTRGRMV